MRKIFGPQGKRPWKEEVPELKASFLRVEFRV